jgi:toxin-antitoxin system PIN domain toxin
VILTDVNILIYAFRSDSKDHAAYRDWLEEQVNSSTAYGIAPQVLSAVMRIATNKKAYAQPSKLSDVLTFCETLLEQPNATVCTPGDRHWSIFTNLCIKSKAQGNLIADAWFAALAIEYGCEWITNDRDYARFPGLKWRTPW